MDIQLGKSLVILRDSVSTEVMGKHIGATTERLCGSKESPRFSSSMDFGVKLRCCEGYPIRRYLSKNR